MEGEMENKDETSGQHEGRERTIRSRLKSSPRAADRSRASGLAFFSREVCFLAFLFLTLFTLLAFFTPLAGEGGREVREFFLRIIGFGTYLTPLFWGMVAMLFLDPSYSGLRAWREFGLYLLWLVSAFLLLALPGTGGSLTNPAAGWLVLYLGTGGAYLLLITVSLLLSLAITRTSLIQVWDAVRLGLLRIRNGLLFAAGGIRYVARLAGGLAKLFSLPRQRDSAEADSPIMPGLAVTRAGSHASEEERVAGEDEIPSSQESQDGILQQTACDEDHGETVHREDSLLGDDARVGGESEDACDSKSPLPPGSPREAPVTQPELEIPMLALEGAVQMPLPLLEGHDSPRLPTRRSAPPRQRYHLPPFSLLDKAQGGRKRRERIPDYSQVLENTLKNFGLEAKVIRSERGPTVTRYELQPASGVKVSKIVSLQDDLALALAAISLRIEAPIPGKSAIGIEVPNSSVDTVYLKDLLESPPYKGERGKKLLLALGKDIAGKPSVADLARMPHLLIAGATGSGKTVCVNTLIASILFRATPEEVQFLMIDPKRVELTIYNGIPHLIREVVTNPKLSAVALSEMVGIMDSRYDTFAEHKVRNIDEYNAHNPLAPFPRIVVVIDELADLMMVASVAVEASIARLAATARAAGIHLIVATQRPSVDVITGTIKANIPSRISFAVSSQADSRTILDSVGAEKLLGRGDMLFLPIEAPKPVRLQGAFVSLEEIEALGKFWSLQQEPSNKVSVTLEDLQESLKDAEENEDDLYETAREIILRAGQASVSLLQRKLQIGYARAGRLIDLMERRGVVGPAEGSKPRKILVPSDSLRLFDFRE